MLKQNKPLYMKKNYMKEKINAVLLLLALLALPVLVNAQNNYFYFSYNLLSYCAPAEIEILNYSYAEDAIGNPVYTWYLNSAELGQMYQPEGPILIPDGGYYTLKMVAIDSYNDSILGEYIQEFSLHEKITDFDISQPSVCPGEKVEFNVRTEVWGGEWDFGDGNLFVGEEKYSIPSWHIYKTAGEYTVRLITENYCGIDTVFKQVSVSTSAIPAVVPVVSNDGYICPNDQLQFDVIGEFSSYLWEFGDGTTSTLKSPVHTYPDRENAEYFPKVTVTNSCGGSNFATTTVRIVSDLEVNADFDYEVINGYYYPCPLTEIKFNPYSSTGRYTWDFGDGVKSFERIPVHRYSTPGLYTVTLNVVNGCGQKASYSKEINIQYSEDYVYGIYFNVDVPMKYNDDYQQGPIEVCPGQVVKFRNTSYAEMELLWDWSFGDESYGSGMHAEHIYETPGEYEVILTGRSFCGAQASYSQFITVSDAIIPDDAMIGAAPLALCPGETVYFFDNEYNPQKKYTYDFNFGDEQSLTGIKTISNTDLFTLADHQYSDIGVYDYSVVVTNVCGNTYNYNGTIQVDDNAERKPFYYVQNSTENEEDKEPEDWSVRQDAADHEFMVTVSWPAWQPEYGNVFQLFLWYGGLDIEYDPGMPDGIVEFTSDNLVVAGERVTFYVPLSPVEPPSIGLAAVYYCGGVVNYRQDGPDAYGVLTDGQYNPIHEVPLMPGGATDLDTLAGSGGITMNPDYYGMCQRDNISGTWYRKINDELYAFISFWDDVESSSYEMEYRNNTSHNYQSANVSSGSFSRYTEGTTMINFFDYGKEDYSLYEEQRTGYDTIRFIIVEDEWTERIQFLDGEFIRASEYEYEHDRSACPGDPVKFAIVGGTSYVWDFADGQTSTEQFPLHSYAEPGTYNVKVTATNSCGRVDELFTQVNVASSNIPDPWFYMEPYYNFRKYDTISFFSGYYEFEFTTNQFLWDFGDGTTSTQMNPKHVYQRAGEYEVKLTVTNGCGSGTSSQNIFVKESSLACIARFITGVEGNTVYFTSTSAGEITSWSWDLGDGSTASGEEITHTYSVEGVYFVTLTVYNEFTNCVSSQTMRVIVGEPLCEADFDFIINNNTGLALFTSAVVGVDKYYWDFGNGNYSTLPNPENTYNRFGFYTVCLTAWNEVTGCMVKTCRDVIYESPTITGVKADFSYIVDHEKRTVKLTNLASVNMGSYYWTVGDGAVYSINNPVHTYKSNGLYEVCLNVSDDATGISDKICKTIIVGEDQCDINASFTFFVNPEDKTVIFRNDSYGEVDKWFWTFGDGTTSARKDPKKIYDKPGNYLVTLSAKNETLSCSDHYSAFIQVGAADCKAAFNYIVDPVSGKVTFRDESLGDVTLYYWEFGDGGFSTQQNPEYTYKRAGVYYPSLTVMNDTKTCVDKISKPVQAGAVDCAAKFSVFVDSLTNTAYFTNRNMGESTQLFWMFGDGNYSTDQNPVHTFVAPGFYSASLNTYNSENNCMDYYSEIIVISSQGNDLHADFAFRPDPGTGVVAFTDKSTGNILEYHWDFGDGNTSDVQNPAHTFETDGYFLVCLSAINDEDMPDMNCKWVPVKLAEGKDCRADFIYTVDNVTRNVVFADASIGAPHKWKWDFADGNTSDVKNPSHIYESKGYYGVRLTIEDTVSRCRDFTYKLINVDEVGKLKASFTYELDTTDNKKVSGYPADFVGSNLGDGATYEWDFGERKSEVKKKEFVVMFSGSRIVTFYYEEPGTYNACLKVTNPQTQQTDTECQDITTRSYGIGVKPTLEDIYSLSVYPNPMSDFTNIIFNLNEPMFIEMAIYDHMGRKLETLIRNNKESGFYQINWNTQTLSPGIYHLRFTSKLGTLVKPLVIAR